MLVRVLEAVEATDGWVTNRVTPHKIILGRLGDVEAGVRQLSDPRPADTTVIAELARYKGLAARWHDWDDVRVRCAALAAAMLDAS